MKPRALALSLLVLPLAATTRAEDGPKAGWDVAAAIRAVDARAADWLHDPNAGRGSGATRMTCVSCHSVLPFALARPALRKLAGEPKPGEVEAKVLGQVRERVAHWADLDDPKYGLYYEFNPAKKRESRGTESVLNALVLAVNDRADGKTAPSAEAARALEIMGATQKESGDLAGSWDWLSFGLQPWEGDDSRHFGATLAALAIGEAPGDAGRALVGPDRVSRLIAYLKRDLDEQSLFNQVATLRASAALDGLLSADDRAGIVKAAREARSKSGGWSLFALGPYVRGDGTKVEADGSDAYATGFVVDALLAAGVPADDPDVAAGLAWLRSRQAASGGWGAVSVNKKRDLTTHVGKFMSDAATSYAALALTRGDALMKRKGAKPTTAMATHPARSARSPGHPSGGTGASR